MKRGLLSTGLLVAATGALAWLVLLYAGNLRNPRYLDGWILLLIILIQIAYRVRRAHPGRAWGRVRLWTHVHVFVGLFAIAALAVHSDLRLPDSRLGWILWTLFALVSMSGLLGIYLTMTTPAKLPHAAKPVRLEEIGAHRALLAAKAEGMVAQAVAASGLESLSEFYTTTLHSYFSGPRHVFAHLRGSSGPFNRLHERLDRYRRLGGAQAASTYDELNALISAKNRLDHQFANEGALRLWLFVHVPATYALVVMTVLHVIIAYSFTSGVP